MKFIEGCNGVIASTMKAYSSRLNKIHNPSAEQCTTAEFDMSYTLLHDVILMEVRAYTMKFVAEQKREEQQMKRTLEERIDKIQNSVGIDDSDEMEELKQCVEDINNKEDEEAARKLLQGTVLKKKN